MHPQRRKPKHSLWNKPVGRHRRCDNLKLLSTGEPLYIPITQVCRVTSGTTTGSLSLQMWGKQHQATFLITHVHFNQSVINNVFINQIHWEKAVLQAIRPEFQRNNIYSINIWTSILFFHYMLKTQQIMCVVVVKLWYLFTKVSFMCQIDKKE